MHNGTLIIQFGSRVWAQEKYIVTSTTTAAPDPETKNNKCSRMPLDDVPVYGLTAPTFSSEPVGASSAALDALEALH